MIRMARLTSLFLFLSLSLLGCTLRMEPPKNYLQLERAAWPYEYQAVSTEDCRLAARTIENPEKGGLDFWSKAIHNQMVQAKGYTLVSQSPVETRGGWKGHEFLFSTHSNGVEFDYLIALFPIGDKIYLAEAGGERHLLEPDLAGLRTAITTLH